MQHYRDARTLVEIDGQTVCIVPVPLDDVARSAELRQLFPLSEGWTHFRYGINRTLRTESARRSLAKLAAHRLVEIAIAGAAR